MKKYYTVMANFTVKVKLVVYADSPEDAQSMFEDGLEDDMEIIEESNSEIKWETFKSTT